MADDQTPPDFPCIRKSCKSAFTRTSPCYHRTDTGVQTHLVVCEACLHSFEMRWHACAPKARVPCALVPPWSAEGKRQLKSAGLYDRADPRCYEDGVVPDNCRPHSATQEQQP